MSIPRALCGPSIALLCERQTPCCLPSSFTPLEQSWMGKKCRQPAARDYLAYCDKRSYWCLTKQEHHAYDAALKHWMWERRLRYCITRRILPRLSWNATMCLAQQQYAWYYQSSLLRSHSHPVCRLQPVAFFLILGMRSPLQLPLPTEILERTC